MRRVKVYEVRKGDVLVQGAARLPVRDALLASDSAIVTVEHEGALVRLTLPSGAWTEVE